MTSTSVASMGDTMIQEQQSFFTFSGNSPTPTQGGRDGYTKI